MGIEQSTIDAAQTFAAEYDADGLLVLLGRQEKAIERDPTLKWNPALDPKYEEGIMGPIDDLKAIGRRVLTRWSKELNKLICSGGKNEHYDELLKALNIGKAAAIAATASLLLAVAPAAVAAPLAALLVETLLIPAKEELCEVWSEQLGE